MAANLRRTAALVLGLTLTVNALNYLRDAALAARFGASPASDAIFSALLLPAILQQMLVAGTLAPAVVPVYLEMAGHSPSQARRMTWQVLLSVAVGLIPLAVLAVFLTPALVNLLFPGFDAATQALTVQALRPGMSTPPAWLSWYTALCLTPCCCCWRRRKACFCQWHTSAGRRTRRVKWCWTVNRPRWTQPPT